MGALNLPSAADVERLTRRLRSLSHRLEGIEDGVGRLDRALSPRAVEETEIGERLSAIEEQLGTLVSKLDTAQQPTPRAKPAARKKPAGAAGSKPAAARKKPAAAGKRAGKAKPKPS